MLRSFFVLPFQGQVHHASFYEFNVMVLCFLLIPAGYGTQLLTEELRSQFRKVL